MNYLFPSVQYNNQHSLIYSMAMQALQQSLKTSQQHIQQQNSLFVLQKEHYLKLLKTSNQQILQLKGIISEKDESILGLQKENCCLESTLKTNYSELSELVHMNQQIQRSLQQQKQCSKQNRKLQINIQTLITENTQLRKQIKFSKQQLIFNSNLEITLKDQRNKINQQLNNCSLNTPQMNVNNNHETLNKQIDFFKRENESLKQIVKSKSRQNQQLVLQISLIKQEKDRVYKSIKKIQNSVCRRVNSNSRVMTPKVNLSENSQISSTPFRILNSQSNQIQSQINEIKIKNSQLGQKIVKNDNQIQIKRLREEMNHNNKEIKSKLKILDSVKKIESFIQ